MKRNICKLLFGITTAIISLCLVASAAEKPSVASEEVINTIKLLEIANGDENGNMNFEKNVTRAEFIKMAVTASANKEKAQNTNFSYSLFPDVKNTFWGAGYISVAIESGLVNGYLDGTFRPDNKVTLEEAATIALRLLGYTSSDFTGTYPSSQIEKYKLLKLDENISAKTGEKLTREECMILLYNTLCANTKSSGVYCTTLGYAANSHGKIDYSSLLEKKMDGPVIFKNDEKTAFETNFTPDQNTLYYLNNSPATKNDITDNDVIYYSDLINSVFIFRKTVTGIISSVTTNSSIMLSDGKSYTIATNDAKQKVSTFGNFKVDDYVTLILGKNDEVIDITYANVDEIGKKDNDSTYTEVVSSSLKGPYIVNSDGSMDKLTVDIDTDTAKVFLKNSLITLNDIKPFDVYYFSSLLETIWIYRDTVSGTIEDIYPISSPTTVVMAGNTYSITTSQASYDLSGFGAFGVGDKASLLLDMNGGVAGVVDVGAVTSNYFGIITDRGTKNFKNTDGTEYSSDYVTVTDTAANSYTYEYSNRSLGIGDIVKVFVSDSLKITEQSSSLKRNDLARVVNAINQGKFADNCNIIEVNGSKFKKVYTSRFKGVNISIDSFLYSSAVLHYQIDENGYLTELILNNFTGDMYNYGVVTYSSGTSLTYMTDSLKKNFDVKGVGCSVGPVAIYTDGTAVSGFKNLQMYVEDVNYITKTEVFDTDNNSYPISENVKVFVYQAGSFKYISLEDALNGNYDYYPFYDKDTNECGLVRVIIAINAA